LNCDSPLSLVLETFKTIGSLEPPPDFLLDMGDRVGHHLLNQSFPQAIETIAQTSALMRHYLPSIPIYAAIGNHDTWPVDQWPDDPYTPDLTQPIGVALFDIPGDNTTIPSSFLEGGYYSQVLPSASAQPIRLVVLNTLWEDSMNLMEMKNGPQRQRQWLNSTLAVAEAAKETVWLMAHVYPESSEVTTSWSSFFSSLVKRYGSTIRYMFFGHTHLDDFVVFSTRNHVGWMPGSIVPFHSHMPSFRVYEWEPKTGAILDYVEWRASLGQTDLVYKPVYRATEAFGLTSMEGSSWFSFWQKMHDSTKDFDEWWEIHGTGNPSLAPCDEACRSSTLAERCVR
jgi:hypothetical protein